MSKGEILLPHVYCPEHGCVSLTCSICDGNGQVVREREICPASSLILCTCRGDRADLPLYQLEHSKKVGPSLPLPTLCSREELTLLTGVWMKRTRVWEIWPCPSFAIWWHGWGRDTPLPGPLQPGKRRTSEGSVLIVEQKLELLNQTNDFSMSTCKER